MCDIVIPKHIKACEQTVHQLVCLFPQHSRHQKCTQASVKNQQHCNCWEHKHCCCNLGWRFQTVQRQQLLCSYDDPRQNVSIRLWPFDGLWNYSLCCLLRSQHWGFWRVVGSLHTGQRSASWPLLPQSCKQMGDWWIEEESENSPFFKVCAKIHTLDTAGLIGACI